MHKCTPDPATDHCGLWSDDHCRHHCGRNDHSCTEFKAVLHTSMGDITIQLYGDMPVTTGNFEKLVQKGPGYVIPDEFTAHNKNNRGTIAMANSGPNTGGSQFFINLVNNNFLDQKHPAFGTVISGMDVVDAIAKVQTDKSNRPLQPVKIITAAIV